jgi:hypothetical protein
MERFISAVMRLAARTIVAVARAFLLRPLMKDCLSIRKNISEFSNSGIKELKKTTPSIPSIPKSLTRINRKNFFTAEDTEESEEKNEQFHSFSLSLRPLR